MNVEPLDDSTILACTHEAHRPALMFGGSTPHYEERSAAMPLNVKSVFSPIDRKRDGLRILATRFRGRGMTTTRYDVWMPSLGPSERLLRAVQSGQLSWPQFSRAFRQELFMDGPIDARSRTIKNHGQKFTLRLIKQLARHGTVTVMCHCAEDERHCHRHILKALIGSARI